MKWERERENRIQHHWGLTMIRRVGNGMKWHQVFKLEDE